MSDRDVAGSDHDEVTELREATARLTDQVALLSEALNTVNALREEQMRQERRLLRTEEAQHDQGELTDHMVGHLIDIDANSVTRVEAVRRWRRVVIGVIIGGLLMITAFGSYEHARVVDLRRLCEQRNEGNALIQKFLDNQVRDAQAGQPPAAQKVPLTKEQLAQLALLRRAFAVVNCTSIH